MKDKHSRDEYVTPLLEIGRLDNGDITCIWFGRKGNKVSTRDVVGACIAIIDGFVDMVDESEQTEAEDRIFKLLVDSRDERHDHIERIEIDRSEEDYLDEEDEPDDN